ncbi:hypothetical protein IFM46972_05727 [Aspergillus udagawae]|uniref:Uncharacterized protein n=1 Tax=Aspergillus udagawae TaxID=91492 RepID=A0A8H3NW43_9EURO|nr:hypothetical protein IFM46972_05727 [Aspergillus udagawae]
MPVPDFRRQTLVKFNFENARVWEFRALSDTMWSFLLECGSIATGEVHGLILLPNHVFRTSVGPYFETDIDKVTSLVTSLFAAQSTAIVSQNPGAVKESDLD